MDSCETGCGSASGGVCSDGFLFDCDLGDPISLLGDCCDWSAGGWVQMGYHDQNLPLFNSRKNDYQLHQAWFYFENVADGSEGFDWGGRVDYVYGTDSQDTQAFGIANTHWDNQWDNGPDYGHALPQVYGEAAYGDFSVKAGHFYTIIGYEVVTAPDNFFYSHAYTMYNSEPFTHTGVLGTYNHSEDVTVYGGYVLGWDSGFEDNGDAFLGGSSVQLTEDVNLTNTIVAGRFADNSGGDERGIMNSLVASVQLTEKTSWIIQNDLLDTEDRNGQNVRETFGVNQYLVHELSDCVSIGTRFEWWEVEADSPGLFGDNATAAAGTLAGDFDVYAITLGMNLKPHANVIIRPEIRWDWVFGDSGELVAADFSLLDQPFDDDQTTFGIDSIILF
ncbi:MAG: porin [Planctomycetota bacterium]